MNTQETNALRRNYFYSKLHYWRIINPNKQKYKRVINKMHILLKPNVKAFKKLSPIYKIKYGV